MRRLTFVALGVLALSGCTGTHIKAPAVCDGKHRRAANLYGSILPTLSVPLPASQGGGQSSVMPGPGPAPLPPPPAPQSAPTPNTGDAPGDPPAKGGRDAPSTAPQTSQRSDPQSYFSC